MALDGPSEGPSRKRLLQDIRELEVAIAQRALCPLPKTCWDPAWSLEMALRNLWKDTLEDKRHKLETMPWRDDNEG